MTSSSRSLQAALSPNGELAAVAYPASNSAPRILLIPVNGSRGVRTTLTASSPSANTSRIGGGAASTVQTVLFANNSTVVALVDDHQRVVAWDLERGVVSYEIPAAPGTNIVSIACSSDNSKDASILLLVAAIPISSNGISEKVQIHDYNREGKLQRKIKAGKNVVPRELAATQDHLVFLHSEGIKVLKASNGKKVSKMELANGINAVVLNNSRACITASGKMFLVDLKSGQVLDEVPSHSDATNLNSWETDEDGGSAMVTDGILIYNIHDDKLEHARQIQPQADLEQRSVLGFEDTVVAALFKRGKVQTQRLSLSGDDNDDDDDNTKETIALGWRREEMDEGDKADGTTSSEAGNKRKLARRAVALGPGQTGGEAAVSEHQPSKRLRKSDDDDDNEDSNAEEDQGPSIEERLRELREAMNDVDSDDDDDDEDGESKKSRKSFVPRKATTESLTELLSQALQSSDDSMLELALHVTDPNILTATCRNMDASLLPQLLNALTTRLATKPARAITMCAWIRAVLLTGKIDSVPHLQPLRNMIQERVESFPALLKLEGRLSMMGKI